MRLGRAAKIRTLDPPSLAALIDLELRLSPTREIHVASLFFRREGGESGWKAIRPGDGGDLASYGDAVGGDYGGDAVPDEHSRRGADPLALGRDGLVGVRTAWMMVRV